MSATDSRLQRYPSSLCLAAEAGTSHLFFIRRAFEANNTQTRIILGMGCSRLPSTTSPWHGQKRNERTRYIRFPGHVDQRRIASAQAASVATASLTEGLVVCHISENWNRTSLIKISDARPQGTLLIRVKNHQVSVSPCYQVASFAMRCERGP